MRVRRACAGAIRCLAGQESCLGRVCHRVLTCRNFERLQLRAWLHDMAHTAYTPSPTDGRTAHYKALPLLSSL